MNYAPIVLLLSVMLAGCATPQEIELRRQQQEQADIRSCVELGFKPGTDSFADCRLRLVEMRSRERTARQTTYHVGYGTGWRGRHWMGAGRDF
jgi:hypothetical protein